MADKRKEKQFLNEYYDLCVKHNMFINFEANNPTLEPNPNSKGNENMKEVAWYAYMMEHIQKLRNKA